MSETYELDQPPPRPLLPGTVVLRETLDDLIDVMAADLLLHAMNCVRAFGSFHLALSGGSTPMPFYRRLMYDPSMRDFPWTRTHLWIVDERRVPFHDDRSNYKGINEILGDHSGIPPEQVHPIFALAEDADARYEKELRECLAWRERGQDRLDYVLLGMGQDGHTASLFPHSPALLDSLESAARQNSANPEMADRLVLMNAGPSVTPPERVTMTLRLINSARFIGVMVTGQSKRDIIARVARAAATPHAEGLNVAARMRTPSGPPVSLELIRQLPILGVRPLGGELRWYLDYAASADAAITSAEQR